METIITLLATLSVASERLTDLIKNRFMPSALDHDDDPVRLKRKQKLKVFITQAISVFSAGFTVYMATPVIQTSMPSYNNLGGQFVLALLISGGSSFWNSIQQYMLSIRKPK